MLPPGARLTVDRLQTGHQQQVDDFKALIRAGNHHRPPGRGVGQELGVSDVDVTSVGQVDAKGPEPASGCPKSSGFVDLFGLRPHETAAKNGK